MLCNHCFANDSVIYLDCYCIFCLECYDQVVKVKIEVASKTVPPNSKPNCPFCSRPTMFKKCDRRNAEEASTIRQLIAKPELANLKALETTKFNLLQNKKHTDYLVKKTRFLENLINYFIKKYSIINFDFPPEIIREDSFGFINRLHQQHRTFSLDQLKTHQNLISHPDFSQADDLSGKDLTLPNERSVHKVQEQYRSNPNPMDNFPNKRPDPYRQYANPRNGNAHPDNPSRVIQAEPYSNKRHSSDQFMQNQELKMNQIERRPNPNIYASSNYYEDSGPNYSKPSTREKYDFDIRNIDCLPGAQTKNAPGFHIQNIRQQNQKQDSSNQKNKHKLQTLLLEASSFTTPIVNKKGQIVANKKA